MVSALPHYSTTGTATIAPVHSESTAESDFFIERRCDSFDASLEEIFDDEKEYKIQLRSEWKAINKAHRKARVNSKSFLGYQFNSRIRGNHVRHKREVF